MTQTTRRRCLPSLGRSRVGFLVLASILGCGPVLGLPSDASAQPVSPAGASTDSTSTLLRDVHSGWARQWGGSASSLSMKLTHPAAGRSGVGRTGLRYYPTSGVRMVDGLHLSSEQAFLYGVRKFELNRGQTALKGADLAGSIGLFAGAMASSFGWMSESDAAWLAGGAAALGAVYGAVAGYESTAWREEWRWPKTLQEDSGVHVMVRPR